MLKNISKINFSDGLIKYLGLFLGIFTNYGWIVFGIWLLIVGEWKSVISGILIILFSSNFLSYILFLPLIFTAPALDQIQKGNKIFGYSLVLVNALLTNIIAAAWCIMNFWIFSIITNKENISLGIIWSYYTSLYPLLQITLKETENNEFTIMLLIATQIACILAIFIYLIFQINLLFVSIFITTIMILSAIIQFAVALRADISR